MLTRSLFKSESSRVSGWDIPILFTNLNWKDFSFTTLSPELDTAPQTGLDDTPQSENDKTLESVLEAEGSSDDLWASNLTGSLYSSDVSPVECSDGSTPSLDVNVLKAELN